MESPSCANDALFAYALPGNDIRFVLDFLVGLIPGLDLILDVAFKANARNAAILKKALDRRQATGS